MYQHGREHNLKIKLKITFIEFNIKEIVQYVLWDASNIIKPCPEPFYQFEDNSVIIHVIPWADPFLYLKFHLLCVSVGAH